MVNLLSAIIYLIIQFFMLSILTDANPLFIFCSGDNHTHGSPFELNLKRLLQSLHSNTSTTGFHTDFSGDEATRVYGQALCRGDVHPTLCKNCIENASKEIMHGCKTVEKIIWYELCQIRYSLQNFHKMMVYTGKFPDSNNQEKKVSDPVHFNKILMYLMHKLSTEASSNPSKNMFEIGEIKYSESTIYGLVQCTRDITGSECSSCLNNILGDLNSCCRDRKGGIVFSRNCNVRFELSRFYNAPSSMLLTYPSVSGGKWKIGIVAAVTCTSAFVIAVLIVSYGVYLRSMKGGQEDEERNQHALVHELARATSFRLTQDGDFDSSEELPFMHLAIIKAATDDFSDLNKLGQGGFGTVYKGVLPNGKEVAVKRLSKRSWQGLDEFKNEIILIAKLQHRNLVRLVGCGIEEEEKLLIYEYTPNKSLDLLIFDFERRSQLDWKMCYNIISGIARGLLYLHEDSRLKIIHRDLKPSNILLDKEMIAKISDFGMARIFGENQNSVQTRRVVGTYGYMAPEYAMEGLFSVKSDVFSFGVVMLEIISGKRNTGFHLTGHAQTLLAYAWQLWNEGKELDFVGPVLMQACSTPEVMRCIHIGLLCVQEDPEIRPTMSSVVALLGRQSIALPEPRQPPSSVGRIVFKQSSTTDPSVSDMTLSSVSPR